MIEERIVAGELDLNEAQVELVPDRLHLIAEVFTLLSVPSDKVTAMALVLILEKLIAGIATSSKGLCSCCGEAVEGVKDGEAVLCDTCNELARNGEMEALKEREQGRMADGDTALAKRMEELFR